MKRLKFIFVCLALLVATPAMSGDDNFFHWTWWDLITLPFQPGGPFGPDAQHRTPLELAVDLPEDSPRALKSKLARIDMLLSKEAATTQKDTLNLALVRASHHSSAVVLRRLLDAGADVNARLDVEAVFYGESALLGARYNPDPAVARLLLDAGADPNIKIMKTHYSETGDGDSALMGAALAGNLDMVTLLLNRGAQVNYQHINCETPCGSALIDAINGHYLETKDRTTVEVSVIDRRYENIVQLLLEHGADANLAADNRSDTPLLVALTREGSIFVPLLLKHGAQVNVTSNGTWPLIAAVHNGDTSSVGLLLASGADVRAVDEEGRNALLVAFRCLSCGDKKLNLIEQLIAAGVPVNAKNGGLSTTLIEAIKGASDTTRASFTISEESLREQETNIFLRLIELGADLDTVNRDGSTALTMARNDGYLSVAEAIERRMTPAERSRMEALTSHRTVMLSNKPVIPSPSPNLQLLSPSRSVAAQEMIHSLAVSPDGRFVAVGGGGLRLWNVSAGVWGHELIGHTETVTSLAFSPDGKHLLSGSHDKSVRLWDVSSGKETRQFVGHAGGVVAVAFFPDGKNIVSGSYDSTFRKWNVESGRTGMIYAPYAPGYHGAAESIAVSPDGHTLLSSGCGGVCLWDVTSGKRQRIYDIPTAGNLALFSPDGKSILADIDAKAGNGIVLFDLAGQERFHNIDNKHDLRAAAFSRDGRRVASISSEGELRLYDAANGNPLAFVQVKRTDMNAVAFMPDNRTIVTGGEKIIMFWSLPSLTEGAASKHAESENPAIVDLAVESAIRRAGISKLR